MEKIYREQENQWEEPMWEAERVITLKVVDRKWMDHLMPWISRQGIGLRASGQRDPVIEYQIEGHEMFHEMIREYRKKWFPSTASDKNDMPKEKGGRAY